MADIFRYKSLPSTHIIQYVPNALASVLTNPANTKSYIRSIILHDGGGVGATVDIHLVPNNAGAIGTANGTNRIRQVAVGANATVEYEWPAPGLVLEEENDTIQCYDGGAGGNKINISIMGGQE